MTETFVKIPKRYVINFEGHNMEIAVYRCLKFCFYEKFGTSRTSLSEICLMCRHPVRTSASERSYLTQIRICLQKMIDEGIVKWDNSLFPQKTNTVQNVNKLSQLKFVLNEKAFDPQDNFIVLYDSEWERIMDIPIKLNKMSLLRTFLYIRYCNVCYKPEPAIAADLNLALQQLNSYLQILVDYKLIVKHITGSFKTKGGIRNAPNIYMLVSAPQIEKQMAEALNNLKFVYGVDEFLPIVYKNKRMREGG